MLEQRREYQAILILAGLALLLAVPTAVIATPRAQDDVEGTGSICLMLYSDDNANGSREVLEGKLSGGEFTLSSGGQVIETYTTDGINEPYCFSELRPGSYTLVWQTEGYEATSTPGWAVTLRDGQTLTRQFGAITNVPAGGSLSPFGDMGRVLPWVAYAGIAIVVLLLSAGLGFMLAVFRRDQEPLPPPPPDDTVAHR